MDTPNQPPSEAPESPRRRRFTSSVFVKVASRDPEGWERLHSSIACYVRGKCSDAGIPSQDSDDLTEEVCADVLRQIHAFRLELTGHNLLRWIRAITRSKIADSFRSRTRRVEGEPQGGPELAFAEIPEPVPDAVEFVPHNDAQRRIFDRATALVLAKVQPQTWKAFWSVTIEDRDAMEVAAKLHMTTHAVREAVYRVRKLLKEYAARLAKLGDHSL